MQELPSDAPPPSGVHTELAVMPDCPVAEVASEVPVAEFAAPCSDGPPQLVVERGADLPDAGVDVVATTEESVVCRLPDRREACPHGRCPACDPGFPPVEQYAVEWRAGRLHLHVAASGTVFATDDGPSCDELGIADANVNFYGVDSDGDSAVTVVVGSGTVYDWNGSQWTRTDLGGRSCEMSRPVTVAGTA